MNFTLCNELCMWHRPTCLAVFLPNNYSFQLINWSRPCGGILVWAALLKKWHGSYIGSVYSSFYVSNVSPCHSLSFSLFFWIVSNLFIGLSCKFGVRNGNILMVHSCSCSFFFNLFFIEHPMWTWSCVLLLQRLSVKVLNTTCAHQVCDQQQLSDFHSAQISGCPTTVRM